MIRQNNANSCRGSTILTVTIIIFAILSISVLMFSLANLGISLTAVARSNVNSELTMDYICERFVENTDKIFELAVSDTPSDGSPLIPAFVNDGENLDADSFKAKAHNVYNRATDSTSDGREVHEWTFTYKAYDIEVSCSIPFSTETDGKTTGGASDIYCMLEISKSGKRLASVGTEGTAHFPETDNHKKGKKDETSTMLSVENDAASLTDSDPANTNEIVAASKPTSISESRIIYWLKEKPSGKIFVNTDMAKEIVAQSVSSAVRDTVSEKICTELKTSQSDWVTALLAQHTRDGNNKCVILDELYNSILHLEEQQVVARKRAKTDKEKASCVVVTGSCVEDEIFLPDGTLQQAVDEAYTAYLDASESNSPKDIDDALLILMRNEGTANLLRDKRIAQATEALEAMDTVENEKALGVAEALPKKCSVLDFDKDEIREYLKLYFKDNTTALPQAITEIMLQLKQYTDALSKVIYESPLLEDRINIVAYSLSLLNDDGTSKVGYFWGGKYNAIGWNDNWGVPWVVSSPGSSSTGTIRPLGLDCSGYDQWVLKNAFTKSSEKTGYPVELKEYDFQNVRTAIDAQANGMWKCTPGDITVLFDSNGAGIHYGIVLSNIDGVVKVIHCTSSVVTLSNGKTVRYDGVMISSSDDAFFPFTKEHIYTTELYYNSFLRTYEMMTGDE